MVFFTAMLGVWYLAVGAFPGSISEYLPREEPAGFTTSAPIFIFSLIWLALVYLSWKGRRAGLVGGMAFAILNLVLTIGGFVSGVLPAPAFSDFLFFPALVFGTIACFNAWRSLKKG